MTYTVGRITFTNAQTMKAAEEWLLLQRMLRMSWTEKKSDGSITPASKPVLDLPTPVGWEAELTYTYTH